MVGLVLVSHSRKLAEAAGELVAATVATPIPIATAGGAGDNHEEFGTDATDIMEAIESVSSPDGVVVLADLGSAVLSAEMALELLGEEPGGRVRICPAPLVEGGVSAAAQIAAGASLEEVFAEAASALEPKQEHLETGGGEASTAPETESTGAEKAATEGGPAPVERRITVHNVHGLHARPASRFVQTVGRFASEVRVSNVTREKGPVSGRSLNKISTLGVLKGDEILVSATGDDAASAVGAIEELAKENFGDHDTEAETAVGKAPAGEKTASPAAAPIAVSEGIAVAPAAHLREREHAVEPRTISDPAREIRRLDDAIAELTAEIDRRMERLRNVLSSEDLEIFAAHKDILADPELRHDVVTLVEEDHYCAEYAWLTGVERVRNEYEALGDEYLRMRAADVKDVGNQLLARLTGNDESRIAFREPTILLARELGPFETASLRDAEVVGIVTTLGGPTSHAAIIARSLGIPYVSGYPQIEKIGDGQLVALDGFEGSVIVEPAPEIRDEYSRRRDSWLSEKKRLLEAAAAPAVTTDGVMLPVFANIGSPEEADAAANAGADGVGLLRTEFLFLDRATEPTEEEQLDAFRQIGSAFGNKPIVVRTLDVGGDKLLPYVAMEREDNPFLGVRGVRLYKRAEKLIDSHLRAILRAGSEHDIRIMVPMIAQTDELAEMLAWIVRIHDELSGQGIDHRWPIPTGIMVETPSAVQLSDHLARTAGFFSIGTNDLTQYTMAAERGNASLARYSDPLHPSVLRSLRRTVETAHAAGIQVAVCGEMAGEEAALPVLLGLGVDELSLSAARIPRVKERIRLTSRENAARIVEDLLELDSAESVREALSH